MQELHAEMPTGASAPPSGNMSLHNRSRHSPAYSCIEDNRHQTYVLVAPRCITAVMSAHPKFNSRGVKRW
jgi:hypothetical protein